MINRYTKRCSTLQVTREVQIKTTKTYHSMPVRMAINERQETTNAGMDVEKREPLCTGGGIVSWYSYYGKQYAGST